MRVGGPIRTYVETHTEADLIAVVAYADACDLPLLVIGGGSNIVAGDSEFTGIVVRDMRSGVQLIQQDACGGANVRVPAGHNWDLFVREAIEREWIGVETLIGIPGTVGAAPVQNIGAYGAEVAHVISSVRVYDRAQKGARTFALTELEFAYRDSRIKRSMTIGDETGKVWGPAPRYIVLEVDFQFRLGTRSAPIQYAELARQLGVQVGERANTQDVAQTVLQLRAGKGMLVDSYERPETADTPGALGTLHAPENDTTPHTNTAPEYDRWSAGSFFTNPILSRAEAEKLPEGAPQYPVHTLVKNEFGVSTPQVDDTRIKTSAAWLIQHAGFEKGYGVHGPASAATLSTQHTLALTNRGQATASDIVELAQHVRDGVYTKYGVTLEPEPMVIGTSLL